MTKAQKTIILALAKQTKDAGKHKISHGKSLELLVKQNKRSRINFALKSKAAVLVDSGNELLALAKKIKAITRME